MMTVSVVSVLNGISVLAIITLGIWCYMFFLRGGFWRIWAFHNDEAQIDHAGSWPRVIAIVPARNETETIGRSIACLTQQDYPGEFRVVVVDDHSDDDTARVARDAVAENKAIERVSILSARTLPAGWTEKLWALNEGLASAQTNVPEFYWFTESDVQQSADTLRRLVARAQQRPSSGARVAAVMALLMMLISFLPVVRFYRLQPLWSVMLPVAASFYCYATWVSTARYWRGRGGQWKGRAQAPKKS